MALARGGRGFEASIRAFASQIHPVFMLPPLAASWFGAIVAGEFAIGIGTVHMLAVGLAVYTAHVKDGYVDFHLRGEDDDHPLTVRGCRLALAGATLAFFACVAVLGWRVDLVAVALTVPGWIIGYLHAPQLDVRPLGATLGYPGGIALAILGGYYVQATAFSPQVFAFVVVFLLVLTGVKIIDDETDYAYDRSIGKRTVAVVLGRRRARRLALVAIGLGLVAVLWFTVSGLFPPSAPAAALVFASIALLARRAPPDLATKLLVRGGYLFVALFVVAVWYRPLEPASLPDITVLGPYTYLATEIVFGTIALGLLVYADALARAARTIAVCYPIAYIWDWYTLEVGVFDIVLRTGIDLFGIPIEEHLFMIVVPAFVLGVHETIRTLETEDDEE